MAVDYDAIGLERCRRTSSGENPQPAVSGHIALRLYARGMKFPISVALLRSVNESRRSRRLAE
eukprot:918974-Prymnesium_polylepis.1